MTLRDKISTALTEHRALALILAAFFVLAATYSIITPIFEAGDEIWHYPYVQHLATGHSLPIQDPGLKTLWAQEGGQPPLYYALASLVTFWIDTRDLPDRLWLNPHAAIGIPLLFGNKNMIVHTSAENFPWRNTALAVHLIRSLSILFSTITVAVTYFFALELQPNKLIAATAAAFVAFNPMFLFISASVNNDSLAAMLAALALWLLVQLYTRPSTTRRFVLLGIILGLAAITKVSDLGLIVIAGGVFAMLLRGAYLATKRSPRTLGEIISETTVAMTLKGISISATLVIVIAGWWYARNWLLYGDPFAFNVWVAIAGGRPIPVTLASLLDEFQGLRISFWGNFGGVNIIAPEWVYATLDAVTIVAGIGLFLGLIRRGLPRLIALPAIWFGLIFVALMRWTMLTFASQGRLLFPAISAIAILLAFGIAQWTHDIRNTFVTRIMYSVLFVSIAFLFIFSVLSPFLFIAPSYAPPKRLAADATVPNPTHIVFDDQAELVGYALPQKSIYPNNELPVTLYWRARQPMTEDFSVYIHLFDADGKKIGQWDAYPGNGLYPTRLWQPNELIVDIYRVPVLGDARAPSVGRVEVGLYRRAALVNLTARDPQGHAITPIIARFKIAGQANVRVENPFAANFEDRVALVGYGRADRAAPGSTVEVRLYWRALRALVEDYTVFVHLVDTSGKTIAQKDDQPQHSAYPTSFWDAGETIADAYTLEIPRDAMPGEYRLRVGVYRAGDGARVRINGGDYLDLGTLQIAR